MKDPRIAEYFALLESKDRLDRYRAAEALGKIGDASAVPALMGALKDEEASVRFAADEALQRIPSVSATFPLFIAALKDNHAHVRQCAVEVLGRAGEASAVPALLEVLNDKSENVRSRAVVALGEIGEASAVPAVVEALKDKVYYVRLCSAEALVKIGDSVRLPRKILAATRLSVQERMDVLDKLRRLRYRDFRTTLRYTFPDTRTLCREVLLEEDAAARAGAQAVLRWLDGDRRLLRPAQSDPSTEAQTLVRPVEGGNAQTPTDTLVRPADEPDRDAEPSPSHTSDSEGSAKGDRVTG